MKKSSIKQLSLLLVLVMLISMFSACAKKTEQTTTTETTAPTEATTKSQPARRNSAAYCRTASTPANSTTKSGFAAVACSLSR